MCLFCVCAVLCLGSGLATGWSHVQGVLPIVNRSGKRKTARAHKGCRANEKKIILQEEGVIRRPVPNEARQVFARDICMYSNYEQLSARILFHCFRSDSSSCISIFGRLRNEFTKHLLASSHGLVCLIVRIKYVGSHWMDYLGIGEFCRNLYT
jgi:hypothetical protein